jgi:hypothetical protein
MKRFTLGVLIVSLVSGSALADSLNIKIGSDDVLRIQAGSQHSSNATIRELEERVYRLERAVAQLQNEVFRLSEQPRKVAEKKVSCYLNTTFDGTITAKGDSKNECAGKVLHECNEKGVAFCKEKDIKYND